MSIKFRVLGGGYFGFGGGGKCRFYFYGREDFSDQRSPATSPGILGGILRGHPGKNPGILVGRRFAHQRFADLRESIRVKNAYF